MSQSSEPWKAPTFSTDPAEVAAACALLRQFTCTKPLTDVDVELVTALRRALSCVVQASDQQILGICADSLTQGQQALAAYAALLGHAPILKNGLESDLEGPVYIKFNPLTSLCYASSYSGSHRGVLVSCQSADPDDVNEMFGHLPLDLFDPRFGQKASAAIETDISPN